MWQEIERSRDKWWYLMCRGWVREYTGIFCAGRGEL
jgi:hypothetical protein